MRMHCCKRGFQIYFLTPSCILQYLLECLWPYLLPVLVVCQGTFYVLVNHLRLKDKTDVFKGFALERREGSKLEGAGRAGSTLCCVFRTGTQGSAHLHLVAVEEVDVGFVLLRILAHQEQHGGVAHLVQHRLAVLDCRQRKVLQLLLEEKGSGNTELLNHWGMVLRMNSWDPWVFLLLVIV